MSPAGQGRPESPVYTNLQELKISQSSLPPLPSSSPLHVLGDWETHKDLTGRHFYYNRASGERTWKPPRVRDASCSTSSSRGDPHGTGEMEVGNTPLVRPIKTDPHSIGCLAVAYCRYSQS